jgi:hypothetical protein
MAKYLLQGMVSGLALRLAAAAPIHDGLEPRNFLAEEGLFVTDNYHPLIRTPRDPAALMIQPFPKIQQGDLQDELQVRQLGAGTDYIKAIPLQTEYLMKVGIGGSNWSMIPDTGSSDTWLMSSAFKCLDRSHQLQSQSYCNFGPAYAGGFSGGKISDEHMNISYGGGDSLNGDMGFAEYVLLAHPSTVVLVGSG